jgi:hypothetical protein
MIVECGGLKKQCWYRCMLYPVMETTNNLSDQAMQEHVFLRKIIGCFRLRNGAGNYQYIASLVADWSTGQEWFRRTGGTTQTRTVYELNKCKGRKIEFCPKASYYKTVTLYVGMIYPLHTFQVII